jgi:hypothetical protein
MAGVEPAKGRPELSDILIAIRRPPDRLGNPKIADRLEDESDHHRGERSSSEHLHHQVAEMAPSKQRPHCDGCQGADLGRRVGEMSRPVSVRLRRERSR